MKYLVTGGCGFIGSHLCDSLLEKGYEVRVLDDLSTGCVGNLPDEAELIIGDVANPEVVRAAMQGVAGCFHLAAVASVERSSTDWVGCHRINQQGTVNVLDAARTANNGKPVPVVYASSAAIYGDNASVPLSEDALPRPISAYGADKLGSEHHARVAWLVHGVPTVGMRFFNVYGPRQDPHSPYSGVISIFIDRIIKGIPLTVFGDGKQTRDFIFVTDVVRFLVAAMMNHRQEAAVFNVSTGQMSSILQLSQTLKLVAGSESVIRFEPARTGDIASSLGDPGKAVARFGLRAKVDLGLGLMLTLESLRREDASYRPEPEPFLCEKVELDEL
ncbi:NAD-dependent epimerase/dehydratase family protein [Aliamphritea hakodatensis]|uniref:NAD-dependent epimerase/dehydratase family protein n=1 Tax=Aliamphritea hakodatensis TaxID=2895352 RepID=UPI0022FD511F|nr:NAD-dependent epimerase/dehydratase family protein [Aliamphritea hakodatensis]